MIALVLIATVLLGAALQRIAGMGFAMVVAPAAVLLLEGQQGVLFANLCGAVASLALIWPVRRDVEWRRFWLLSSSSVAGAAAGALIVRALDLDVFRIVMGVILLAAIAAALLANRSTLTAPVTSASLIAGGATGLLVTMSGIGAPPMSVYVVVTRWNHRAFAATMQPFIAVSSLIGAVAIAATAPGSVPQMPDWVWAAVVLAMVVGLTMGQLLARRVPAHVGRAIVIALGLVGAVSAITAGVNALLA